MIRVLFVDDEPNVLGGLRRILRPMRSEWNMSFISNGVEALSFVEQTPCDVVISDMKMPGMDGAELLSLIRERCPDAIRIALSGETDSHMIYRCVEHAHQYVAKPCDIDILVNTIHDATRLRNLMSKKTLKELVSRLSTIPSMPEQYRKIVHELQAETPSLDNVAKIVETDAGMSAKIVQLVNSAFFGLARHVSSPSQAAVYLGLDVIKGLVLTTGVFSQFDPSVVSQSVLDELWNRSMRVAKLARDISLEQCAGPVVADYAYMGGLLSEIGKLIFAANLPGEFCRIQQLAMSTSRDYMEIEREVIGHTHAEVGAYLAGLWGLPNPVVECVAFYRNPSHCTAERFTSVGAVHLAYSIVEDDGDGALHLLDRSYTERLGLIPQVEKYGSSWRQLAPPDPMNAGREA